MKPKLILVSHGTFAESVKKTAEMIVGAIDGMYTVTLLENEGLEEVQKKLDSVFDEIGAETPAVIAADLFAGSPCNVSVQAMFSHKNIRVLTGLNLPMAIEYSFVEMDEPDKLAAYLCEAGTESIKIVEKPQTESGVDGYED